MLASGAAPSLSQRRPQSSRRDAALYLTFTKDSKLECEAPQISMLASRSLGLGTAFPLGAAAEPIAQRRNTGRVAVEQSGNRKRQGPEPGEAVKAHGHRKRGCH